jgi:hypothetical protein
VTGEDGIPSEAFKSLVETLPRYITAIYSGCLRKGIFPKRWKKAMIIPVTKPGKEGSDEVSKFCPISLLDIGGKVLEKLLINRINQHVFSREHMKISSVSDHKKTPSMRPWQLKTLSKVHLMQPGGQGF